MTLSLSQLDTLLASHEGPRLEFKKAAESFKEEDTLKCCCALSNEGGGWLILGVEDEQASGTGRRPVVGSAWLQEPKKRESFKLRLWKELHVRVEIEELQHPDGRVLLLRAPGRSKGALTRYAGVVKEGTRVPTELPGTSPLQLPSP